MRLKCVWLVLVLIFSVEGLAFDPTFSGPEGPAFVDPKIVQKCGPKVRFLSMRAAVQTSLSNMSEKTITLESEVQHDLDGRSGLQFQLPYLPKLARYIKTHRVLTVVCSQKQVGPIFKDTHVQFKICLVEGKPLEQWY